MNQHLTTHGHAIQTRTPHPRAIPIRWRVTTLCGLTLDTAHAEAGSVRCPECLAIITAPERTTHDTATPTHTHGGAP